MSKGARSGSRRSESPGQSGQAGRPSGRLVVVATPIGNLADVSARAASALAGAHYIYCEDTRRTLKLLTHLGISGPRLVSHHRFNEASTTPAALQRLREGATVALVSDAGTPLVSDPGTRLVRAAIEEGFAVEAVPGPSAVLAALVVSGLATERWCFEGFLAAKGRRRADGLAAIAAETERAVVLFEAPQRLGRLLDDLAGACGPGRPVAVCRELTKLHEEVWRGPVGEAAERARSVAPRGEHVVVVGVPSSPAGPRAGAPAPGRPKRPL